MASSINPNNISVTFPVAGQDNDSQGFRDNFNNIKTGLTTAKTELEDLQSKVVLKSALTGTALANDGSGSVMEDFELKDMALTIVNKGTMSGVGTATFDVSAGHFQCIETKGNMTLAFTNFPATGKFGWVEVEIDVDATASKVILPAQCTVGVSDLADYVATTRTISFHSAGKYTFRFSTYDAGTTIAVEDVNRGPSRIHGDTIRVNQTASPRTGTGASTDKAGMMSVDASSIYVCTADYDGSTSIWKEVDVFADEATSNRLLRTGGNQITGDILPATTNTHDLGSSAKKFAQVHSTTLLGALTGNVTGDVAGNVTGNVTGDVTGGIIGDVQALSGAGAVNTTTLITQVTTTGTDALTLPNGTNGQIKIITMVADGGVGTLTPTTFANGTTLAFNDVGDSVMLVYNTTGGWALISNTGCTLA